MAKGSELTEAQRKRIAELWESLELRYPERERVRRKMAERTGIDVSTIDKIKHCTGGVGVSVLIRLRKHLGMSIDLILDLEALPGEKRMPAQRTITKEVDDADPLPARRWGAGIARAKGVPEYLIEAVRARHGEQKAYSSWTRKRWADAFLDAWEAEKKLQAAVRDFGEAKTAAEEPAPPRVKSAG